EVDVVAVAALGPHRLQLLARRAAAARGPLPDELAMGDLAHLHFGHGQLVRRRRAGEKRYGQDKDPASHFAASYFTVYFLARTATAALRCSAIVASVQSCSTTPRSVSKSAGLGGVIASSWTARRPSLVARARHSPAGDASRALANASPYPWTMLECGRPLHNLNPALRSPG